MNTTTTSISSVKNSPIYYLHKDILTRSADDAEPKGPIEEDEEENGEGGSQADDAAVPQDDNNSLFMFPGP